MFHRSVPSCSLVSVATSIVLLSGWAQADQPQIAGVRKHTSSDGVSHQAILLKCGAGLGAAARQHVILVDTSASQVGEHRLHAQGVLEGLLSELPRGDRVKLLAIDVHTEPLTADFVAPDSAELRDGINQLKARVPLGSTNLIGGLETARTMLADDQPASIVYIGDGLNTAGPVNANDLQSLVTRLREQQAAVHSYGVGPQLNLHLLGIFALQTGGVVQFDTKVDAQSTENGATARGQRLARAVQQPIFRPESIQAPRTVALIPNEALPLRADRETIYLVRGDLPIDGLLTAKSAETSLSWKLGAPTEGLQDKYLSSLIDRTIQEGSLANSLAGVSLLNIAEDEFSGQVDGMVNYGKLALLKHDLTRVQQVIDAVRHIDPANRDLDAVEKAAEKLAGKPAARRQLAQNDAKAVPSSPPPAEEPDADNPLNERTQPNPQSSLLDDEQRAIKIRTEKLRQEVSDTINLVRRTSDPQLGLEELDRMLNTVRSSLDVEPDVRVQLQKQLGSERLAQVNRREILERNRIRIQERLVRQDTQERLIDQLEQDENRLALLIDRVRHLMDEGNHGDDAAYAEAEAVARVAVEMRPLDGTTAAALFGAEAAQQLRRSFRLRARRNDMFLEALHQVELSHIPFPDEPPILFPPAPVWAALTERRRKWKTVDLRKESPNEARISEALHEQTEVSFVDATLRDAMDYIEDLHRFDIIINEQEITEEGLNPDVTINLELSGIMLRSALRLMLEPHQLTYVIKDEVMQITTIEKAKDGKYKTTRVYPVADLAIPIMNTGGGMGGGMMGGGMGGMGGGMGGMGGGMGGMGGMGGGMGGMGGGMGGMFSLPPEQPFSLKKKR